MDPNTDDEKDLEIEFLQSAPRIIEDILRLFKLILWRRVANSDGTPILHRYVRMKDLAALVAKIDTFQEHPQLLDVHLQSLISQLASAYLATLGHHVVILRGSLIPLSRAISKVLYMFCKVRGDKIIVGFLNNEPKHLEPLLAAVEAL